MVLTNTAVREIRRLGVPENDAYLFPSKRASGKPFAVEAPFKRLVKRTGLEHARLHDMRHTVVSTLAREGRIAVEIATILGHKSLEVVKRYTHINVKAKVRIVQNSALNGLK